MRWANCWEFRLGRLAGIVTVDPEAERAGDRVRELAALNEADEHVDETEGERAIEGCGAP